MARKLAARWPGRCFADGPTQMHRGQRMFAPMRAPQRAPEPSRKVDDTPLSVRGQPLPSTSPSRRSSGLRRGGREEARPPLAEAPLAAGRRPAPSNQQAPYAVWNTAVTCPCGARAPISLPWPGGVLTPPPVCLNVYSEDSPPCVSDPETYFTAKNEGLTLTGSLGHVPSPRSS